MSAVAFDYYVWAMRYPELARSVPMGLAQSYFAEAGLYLDNSGASPVCDDGKRGLILGMIVAHIAALNAPLNGEPSSTLVGRISTASEGSVSIATDLQVPGTAGWWAQTKYGLAAYQALAGYRTMRYFTGCRRGYQRTWR